MVGETCWAQSPSEPETVVIHGHQGRKPGGKISHQNKKQKQKKKGPFYDRKQTAVVLSRGAEPALQLEGV